MLQKRFFYYRKNIIDEQICMKFHFKKSNRFLYFCEKETNCNVSSQFLKRLNSQVNFTHILSLCLYSSALILFFLKLQKYNVFENKLS